MAKKKNYVRVSTPKGRLSFPNLLEPDFKYLSKTEKEYSAKILIEKTQDVSKLQAAIEEAAKELDDPEGFNSPLVDGDTTKSEYENGYWVLRASSKVTEKSYPPKVVDHYKKDITDPSLVYSGCNARLGLSLGAYDVDARDGRNYGVKAYLNSALILPGGDPWAGGVDDLFEGLDLEEIADEALAVDEETPF